MIPRCSFLSFLLLLLCLTLVVVATADNNRAKKQTCYLEKHFDDHPLLCDALDRLSTHPQVVQQELHEFAQTMGNIVDVRPKNNHETNSIPTTTTRTHRRQLPPKQQQQQQLPVVLLHGMGDSCFNDGMQHVTKMVSQWLNNVYTVCIPMGPSRGEDTQHGYFLNMNDSVEIMAQAVQADPQLQHGFHALGFSQGNNVIRGYIARHNHKSSVHTFVSVNGVNAGIAGLPYCPPTAIRNNAHSTWCQLLAEQASLSAYTEFAQQHNFQANYWRDPKKNHYDQYLQYSQLADWNNEGDKKNQTYKDNWNRTAKFVWILAVDDQMVWPALGEHWGCPDENLVVHPMKDSAWYIEDWFGLQTADRAGKNVFESFAGDHLQFSLDELQTWVQTHLAGS